MARCSSALPVLPVVQVLEKGCARAVSLHCFLPCSLVSVREQTRQDGPTHRAKPVGTTSLPTIVAMEGTSRWTVMLPSIPILCPFATSFISLSRFGAVPFTRPPPEERPVPSGSPLPPAAGGVQRLHRAWVAPGAGTRLAAASASRRGAEPTAVQSPGRGAGRHPPGSVGRRGVKPAKSREKQIKMFPFSKNNCLPNYCGNYRPKGEAQGEGSSVGRGRESRSRGGVWRAVSPPARAPRPRPTAAFPASLKAQDEALAVSSAGDTVTWPVLSSGGSKSRGTCRRRAGVQSLGGQWESPLRRDLAATLGGYSAKIHRG